MSRAADELVGFHGLAYALSRAYRLLEAPHPYVRTDTKVLVIGGGGGARKL